jgi:hypothetical protein
MRNLPFSPLPASQAINEIARFHRIKYVPSLRGYWFDFLAHTKVLVQTMDFVGLHDGSCRPAPPMLIGPAVADLRLDRLVEEVSRRLTAVTAIAAVVGDNPSANAIEKAIVCAQVFKVTIRDDARADFEAWRSCRGSLSDWYWQRCWNPSSHSKKPTLRRAHPLAGRTDDVRIRSLR